MALVTTKKKTDTGTAAAAQSTTSAQTSTGGNILINKLNNAISQAQAQQAAKANTYTGLQGLSTNTAQQIKNNQNYVASQAVNDANAALQSIQNQKPKDYESKYSAALDSLLQQIQNPQQFKYSFNGDELFKNLADVYTQKGKQASLDAMGQAAGLTGGYGNSYGQMVGQQQYQQYLMDLYDKGIDLYDRAYQRYMNEQNGLYDQYNLLANADNTDYGRYRDTVGDWRDDLTYYTNRADTLADRDYNQFADTRNYWTNLGGMENSDWWTGQNYAETQKMNDASIAQADRDYAYNVCAAILANGEMPTDEQLAAAGISKADAKKMKAKTSSGGGGRGGGGGGQKTAYVKVGSKYFKINEDGSVSDKGVTEDKLPKNAVVDKDWSNNVKNVTTGAADIVNTVTDQVVNSKPVQAVTQTAQETAERLRKFLGL